MSWPCTRGLRRTLVTRGEGAPAFQQQHSFSQNRNASPLQYIVATINEGSLQYIVASSTGLINCHLEQGSGDLAASGREAMKNILETGTWIVHLFLGIIFLFWGVVYLFSLNEKQIRNSGLDNLFFCHLLFSTMRLFFIFLFNKSGESHLSPSRDRARQIDARFLLAS